MLFMQVYYQNCSSPSLISPPIPSFSNSFSLSGTLQNFVTSACLRFEYFLFFTPYSYFTHLVSDKDTVYFFNSSPVALRTGGFYLRTTLFLVVCPDLRDDKSSLLVEEEAPTSSRIINFQVLTLLIYLLDVSVLIFHCQLHSQVYLDVRPFCCKFIIS